MLMEMSMRDSGRTTRPMVMEYMCTSMVLNMKVTGRMICRMELELRVGQTAQSTREATKKA